MGRGYIRGNDSDDTDDIQKIGSNDHLPGSTCILYLIADIEQVLITLYERVYCLTFEA